jgi:hypothetical protein
LVKLTMRKLSASSGAVKRRGWAWVTAWHGVSPGRHHANNIEALGPKTVSWAQWMAQKPGSVTGSGSLGKQTISAPMNLHNFIFSYFHIFIFSYICIYLFIYCSIGVGGGGVLVLPWGENGSSSSGPLGLTPSPSPCGVCIGYCTRLLHTV